MMDMIGAKKVGFMDVAADKQVEPSIEECREEWIACLKDFLVTSLVGDHENKLTSEHKKLIEEKLVEINKALDKCQKETKPEQVIRKMQNIVNEYRDEIFASF